MSRTTAKKTAVAIRHVMFEDVGSFAAPLAAAGYSLRYLEAGYDDLAPAADADLVIVLGGPISVNDTRHYPFLHDEIALLRARLLAEKPTLGICLGGQLIAKALHAHVHSGIREIGWEPLKLNNAGANSPLRHLAPELTSMLHWHGDTFDLPHGAVLLASTPACRHQAFAVGAHALALQFHPEFDPARLEQWLIGHAVELVHAGVHTTDLRDNTRHHGERLVRQGALMLKEWLRGLPDQSVIKA
jgi:GMP synthase (glutamine-hydrolysing)